MRYAVAVIAVSIILMSGIGVLAPNQLIAIMASWPSDGRLYVAAAFRLVLGLTFIAAARSCSAPALIRSLGVIAVAAAVLLVALGADRLDALIRWWSHASPWLTRLAYLGGVAIGALVWYGAVGRRRAHGSV